MNKLIQPIHKFILTYRVQINAIIFLLLLVGNITAGVRPLSFLNLETPFGPMGLLLILAGVFMRSWAAGVLIKTESLATEGPYYLTRHPLYLGSLQIALGIVAILNRIENLWMVIGLVVLLYLPKIKQEDQRLARIFGEDWTAYLKATSWIFPKSLPVKLRAGWSSSQWLRKREYRAFSVGIFSLILFEMLHHLR